MYFLTNVAYDPTLSFHRAIPKTHMCMRNSIPCGLINEYTYRKMASNSRSNLCSHSDSLFS